ncbi:three-Cys-motif partner protein [Epilithonimonas hungarica]|uniref:three-Cys-motif partner protein TcmP n=1 Tax=Epilithonimonas hungarica TaxID=454006 RepID=UPI00278830C2|nr:three-Cys-motif partner protein TcmP [Epilithonimonas hungarica]MDP9958104.1 three-Cys-motif partner protein [Epilithonimonas hungarica]
MKSKKHFSKPFDDGTKAKLEIFTNYFTEWLPVFISSKDNNFWEHIIIYDFFAGEGKDSEDNFGSPLIILNVLNKFNDLVVSTGVKIRVILNESNIETLKILQNNVNNFDYNRDKIEVLLYNKPFNVLFGEIFPVMSRKPKTPRLMILDQFGIKEITEEIFKKLIALERTDFIFFISSSFVRRFNELPEFSNYIKIKKKEFDESKPFHCHRVVFDYYRSLIDNDYKLAPFSIKKGINIYGLIFGSNHTYGMEKFLKVGWNINPHTGDANFNIDGEKIIEGIPSLFEEYNTIKKIELLNKKLERNIFEKKETSLYNLYVKTLEFGCQPVHCNDYLKKLEKEKKITINGKLKSAKIHTLANYSDVKITLIK